jgi:hypothetical protein
MTRTTPRRRHSPLRRWWRKADKESLAIGIVAAVSTGAGLWCLGSTWPGAGDVGVTLTVVGVLAFRAWLWA